MLTKQDIVTLRNDLGESQEKFASRFGLTQGAVSRWETDGPPTRGLVARALEKLRARTPAPQPSTEGV